MTAEPVITPLLFSDLDQLIAIENLVFTSPWSRQSYEEMLALETVRAWAARWNGRLVGYLLSQWWGEEMELHSIGVAPHVQRHGIGRKLMTELFSAADQLKVQRIFLLVRPSNAAARFLYETSGFRSIGRRRRYYEDNGEDAVVMRWQAGG